MAKYREKIVEKKTWVQPRTMEFTIDPRAEQDVVLKVAEVLISEKEGELNYSETGGFDTNIDPTLRFPLIDQKTGNPRGNMKMEDFMEALLSLYAYMTGERDLGKLPKSKDPPPRNPGGRNERGGR